MSRLTNKPNEENDWTLFLDRDGVINVESVGSYITNWSEFHFHDGVLMALKELRELFATIVVVTNQRGVGKGIMAMDDLREIHANMCREITDAQGRIDKVYSCIAVADADHNRKPNVGMGIQAQQDFPNINFKRSVMVGNSMSDMEFGKRLGMYTVFLTTKHAPYELPHDFIDEQFGSLHEWTESLIASEMVG